MMIPEFLYFYKGYSAESVLQEYARRFFSLVNSMYQIKAQENLLNIAAISTGMNGNEEYINSLKKQSKGLKGVLDEVRIVKGVK